MEIEKRYQISGVPGHVYRSKFQGRTVDYWSPDEKTSHLLIAHDGQNVFDHRTATRHRTWKMAQSAINVSGQLGLVPPVIIGVFHGNTKENPWGRVKDLAPQDPFQQGVVPQTGSAAQVSPNELMGNEYLRQITEDIAPAITAECGLELALLEKAVIGSSMGGLASLYALGKRPDFFSTALSLSPHWIAGGDDLVDALVNLFPEPGEHKIWMSHGTRGHDAKYGPHQHHADELMKKAGWTLNKDYRSHVYKKSGHNERSWARYLDQPMSFWLTSSAKSR
ncbi:MAG: alpha/beta hydrolase-fold protein [Actinobacteria bacterium]|nr:alpha/beta hydrolase-fold protein [Actinomycetota bacterium]